MEGCVSFNCAAQYEVELVERLAAHHEQPDHVLERAGHEEVLLCQPQLLSGFGFVVRIEDLGDGFRCDLLVHRPVVVADVERFKIKGFGGFGLPQAQQVCGGRPIAGTGVS